VVPRNHHPGIPLRAAFATVLSGCDAEFALRVDPPCLSQICAGISAAARASARKSSIAQPYIITIAGGTRSIAKAPATVVSIATQGRQRGLHKFVHVPAALRIVERCGFRRPIAVARLPFPAKLG
jgi:hypothetical protein